MNLRLRPVGAARDSVRTASQIDTRGSSKSLISSRTTVDIYLAGGGNGEGAVQDRDGWFTI